MFLGVVLSGLSVDHDCLCGALLADQQHGLALLGDGVDEVVRAHVVHVRNQDGGVLGRHVGGIVVLRYLGAPVGPLSWGRGTEKDFFSKQWSILVLHLNNYFVLDFIIMSVI